MMIDPIAAEREKERMSDGSGGFPPETFRFLRGLKRHNDKDWFESHKHEYQEFVLRPLQTLVEELSPVMLGIDPMFEVAPVVNKTISRVYRDTRFSADKTPYKTNHWITFRRPGKEWQSFPAYFFQVSPDSYCFGMGFYSADRTTMDRIRAGLDADPAAFLKTVSFHRKKQFSLEGETYKRPLKPDLKPALQDWYNRRSFYLIAEHPVQSQGIDASLATDLAMAFMTLAPLYRYLVKLIKP
jgi:uncharacterized protein (TIGR02453 family)